MMTEFKSLASALQSGNLSDAQDAFSQIQIPGITTQNTQPVVGTQDSGKQTQIKSDFDALGKALQSGDVKSAQDAFKKLTQNMQSTGKVHHHHHHRGGSAPVAAQAANKDNPTDTGTNTDSSGTTIDALV
jgi:hypothetical protein